jgi:hypothetical protein
MRLFPRDRPRSRRPIDISAPRAASRCGRHRAEAVVDGRRVWFASDDASLAPAAEAFGGALLVPALEAGRPLRLAGSICPTWAANFQQLADTFGDLWYPHPPRPLVVPGDGVPECGPDSPVKNLPHGDGSASPARTALCFSGGVDAFHALLAGGRPIDTLVYVVGYDVKLRDRRRGAAVSRLVRDVAAHMGCQSVVMSTNLRQHPLLKATPWVRSYAGPLAAIGHLLADRVGRLLIASDGLAFVHSEVSSRPDTDPLFGSARLAIEHLAAHVTRFEKIAAIAAEPLVQQHLRVCWQTGSYGANCGRCEKCVRTMLAIDACGRLGTFAGFNHGRSLEAAIDRLPGVNAITESFYRDLLGRGLSAGPTAAVRRLLARSGVRPEREHRTAGRRNRPSVRHRLLSPAAFTQVCMPLVGRRVGYVRPEGNVGDALIEAGMIQLFAEYGIRWQLVTPAVPGETDGLDLLVFGGGGNMGTRYPGNHALRTQALATGLPVVILPQSFTGPEDRPFAEVFVREQGSLAVRPDGILAPDLALGLATARPLRPARDLGVFLRRDQERTGRKPLFTRDPVRLFRDPFAYLAFAARHRRIVTDRLHFAIAGLHAGRDVTLVANDYHKNRSLHETWLADLGCRFAATPGEALSRRAA